MTDTYIGPSPTSNIEQWAADFFTDADLVDIDKLAAWFAEDVDLRFANNPPIHDKATACEVMSEFYDSISGMQHDIQTLVAGENTIARQAIVTYTRLDGVKVPLPVSSYLSRNSDGLMDKLWIYIDITPLYEGTS